MPLIFKTNNKNENKAINNGIGYVDFRLQSASAIII